MKSVLISIRPEWCEKIASGEKTVEVRKTMPKCETPFRCYIYCTKDRHGEYSKHLYINESRIRDDIGVTDEWRSTAEELLVNKAATSHAYRSYFAEGKVIGEFVCDSILDIQSRGIHHNYDYCFANINIFGNDDIEPYVRAIKKSCIGRAELNEYGKNAHHLYGWRISDLKIYDKPRELIEFHKKSICAEMDCYHCAMHTERGNKCGNAALVVKKPPQSWMYVEPINE